MIHARITGTGSYLPAKVLSNADLAARMDTSDEWIASRTGIRQRHVADTSEMSSDLAVAASRRALALDSQPGSSVRPTHSAANGAAAA